MDYATRSNIVFDSAVPAQINAMGFAPKLVRHIEALNAAMSSGSIQNTVMADAKSALNRALEDEYGNAFAGYRALSLEDRNDSKYQDVYDAIFVHPAMHAMKSARKEVMKIKSLPAVRDAAISVLYKYQPAADSVTYLKDKIVKRQPKTEEQKLADLRAANPNKLIKTCPWCFRAIAVQGGTMAHHGYQRPGEGYQTASCPGINYKPLEVSSDGLKARIESEKRFLATSKKELANADHWNSLPMPGVPSRHGKFVTQNDDARNWDLAVQIKKSNLESGIRFAEHSIDELSKKLAAWKPEA